VICDSNLFAFWSPGPAEMMVLAVVALLLYGGNLPEVARSWGKTFSEFRRGLSGFQNELNDVIYSEPDQLTYQDEYGHDGQHRDDAYLADGYEESEYVEAEDAESDASESTGAEPAPADGYDESTTDTTLETEGDVAPKAAE